MFVNEKTENKSKSSQVIEINIKEMTNRCKKTDRNTLFRLFYDSKFGGYRVAKQPDMRRIVRENNKCRKKQN